MVVHPPKLKTCGPDPLIVRDLAIDRPGRVELRLDVRLEFRARHAVALADRGGHAVNPGQEEFRVGLGCGRLARDLDVDRAGVGVQVRARMIGVGRAGCANRKPAAPAISRRRIAMLIPGNCLEVNCESPIINPFRAFDGDESELLQSHQLAN